LTEFKNLQDFQGEILIQTPQTVDISQAFALKSYRRGIIKFLTPRRYYPF